MYIWVAIDVNEQLKKLRENVEQITAEIKSRNTALTLPLHISLRISFPVDDSIFEEVVNRISEYYGTLSAFDIDVQEIEKNGSVVWVKMAENRELTRIHEDLVLILQEEYGVQPHEFDKAYLYHVTLLLDKDSSKAELAYPQLREQELPNKLAADKVVIGCSESGLAGEYDVIREFSL